MALVKSSGRLFGLLSRVFSSGFDNGKIKELSLKDKTRINWNFVTDEGYDICILCKIPTSYQFDISIDEREFYISGAGQLCQMCYNRLYSPSDLSNSNFQKV